MVFSPLLEKWKLSYLAAAASRSEFLLHDFKAKSELAVLEKSATFGSDAKLVRSQYEKIETEIKLAKLRREQEDLNVQGLH